MRRKLLFVTCLFLSISVSYTQDDCYKKRRKEGIAQYEAQQYGKALEYLEAAKKCPEQPGLDDIDDYIKKCRQAQEVAQQAAQREEQERLAAQRERERAQEEAEKRREDCYPKKRKEGIAQYEAQQYDKAIQYFRDAKECPEQPGLDDIDDYIKKCRQAQEAAQQAAQREEQERLAAQRERERVQEEAEKRRREERERQKTATYLSTSTTSLYFSSYGSTSTITVNTDGKSYEVTNLPSWCSIINRTSSSFQIVCQPNTGNTRTDWIIVKSDAKEVHINVEQTATYVRTSISEKTFDGKGGTQDISVESGGKPYSVSNAPDWCSIEQKNGFFTVTCRQNYGAHRNATLIVTVDNKTTTVNIQQTEATATYINSNLNSVKINALGESKEILIQTDGYSWSYSAVPTWITASKSGKTLTLAVGRNQEEERSGSIKISSGNHEKIIMITQPKEASYIKVNKDNIRFSSNGSSKAIKIQTDGEKWSCTNVPNWIKIQQERNNLILKCNENAGRYSSKRKGSFTVKSDDETATVYVKQSAPFNLPKGDERLFGLSVGYVKKQWEQKDENGTEKYGVWEGDKFINGIQAGVRIEPLFKYGFGLNTGLFYEYYFAKSKELTGTYTDAPGTFQYQANYTEHSLYLPIHLEYRANISDNFQFFVEAGPSIDIGLSAKVTATEIDEKEPYYTETNIYANAEDGMGHKRFNLSADVGGGFRVNGLQLNVGRSFGLLDISSIPNASIKQNKLLTATLSWMIPHESWDDIPVNSADRGYAGTYGEHGLVVGYISKQWEWKSDTYIDKSDMWGGNSVSGLRLGYTYQPSFGYGFGIATGLNFDTYLSLSDEMYDDYGSYDMTFEEMSINIPAHLEYRLHFAENFSMFFEFGPSLDIGLFSQININSDNYDPYTESDLYGKTDWGYPTNRLNVYLDFIGGVRIWKFQLSAGVSRSLTPVTVNDEFNWEIRQNRNLMMNLGIFF
jgi:hypothetical protein